MEQLFSQQNSLDNEINQNNDYEKSDYARLSQQEKRNLEELGAINDLIKQTAETIKPFSDEIADKLIKYSNDSLMNQTNEIMSEINKILSSARIQKRSKIVKRR